MLDVADATDALRLAEKVTTAGGGEYDLVVSCVSVARAEMAAILPTRSGGTVYFFSMATSFTAAALGAEGVSKDIDMLVGNGYCTGHADETLAWPGEHKACASCSSSATRRPADPVGVAYGICMPPETLIVCPVM